MSDKTYDASKAVITFGGVRLEGFADGVRIEAVEHVTRQGSRRLGERSGSIEVTMVRGFTVDARGRLVPLTRYWLDQRPRWYSRRLHAPHGRAWRRIRFDRKRKARAAAEVHAKVMRAVRPELEEWARLLGLPTRYLSASDEEVRLHIRRLMLDKTRGRR